MIKRLPAIQIVLSLGYIVFNFKKISAAFRSDIWSKEIDLINHVTNYSVHLQLISIVLMAVVGVIIIANIKKIDLSKYLLGVVIMLTALLFINTQIDFIRWIEINVFGGGSLLLLAIFLIINLIWKSVKSQSVSS